METSKHCSFKKPTRDTCKHGELCNNSLKSVDHLGKFRYLRCLLWIWLPTCFYFPLSDHGARLRRNFLEFVKMLSTLLLVSPNLVFTATWVK